MVRAQTIGQKVLAERWEKAFRESGILAEYTSLTNELMARYSEGRRGENFFGEAQFERLEQLAVIDRKLYSLYTGRKIECYGDLEAHEKKDINHRLRKSFEANELRGVYDAAECAKGIVDRTYREEDSSYQVPTRRDLINHYKRFSEQEKKGEGFKLSMENVDNVVLGGTMALIAADAALSLIPEKKTPENQKRQANGGRESPVPQEKSGNKLTFRKVISVGATLGMIATGALWIYRIQNGNRQQQGQTSPQR